MSDLDREEICPDCQAGPDAKDATITSVMKDPETGEFYTVATWHLDTCPAYTVNQILMEDGARRAKEQSEWGRKEFPAAHERLLRAMMRVKLDAAAEPFVAALVDLVEAQGEDLGRIVLPERWAQILNRHFPPEGETSARGEEPT
jgi:hypothetical protein